MLSTPLRYVGLTLCLALPVLAGQSIEVQIKGFDDGVKSTAGQDYKEAVLFAKREAIERAGVTVKSLTTIEDYLLRSDYIESQAEAVLEPGYDVLDIGYQSDGSYLVVLTGKVSLLAQGEPSDATPTPESPLFAALSRLSAAPQQFELSLSDIGSYPIEKAYFANNEQFVIHYDYRNGVMTLNEIDKGIMQLAGTYRTDTDSGKVKLDFNSDGSADGRWTFFLASGAMTIRRK
ncbi:MAG: hypothetical protein GYB58_14295 [Gammaproteobacteria bacterium]|nr:hypothetical protein [Gammaproteobacteria bacterium]